MRIYSESRLSPAVQQEPPLPLGSILIPRGSSVGAFFKREFANRLTTYWDFAAGRLKPQSEWATDDRENASPPRAPALAATAWLLRHREEMGLPPVKHLFIDLENHLDDRDGLNSLAAAYYLRADLPKSILVSCYSRWSGSPERVRPFFEIDDSACYTLYASNRVIEAKDQLAEWMRMVDESEDEVESIEPDKPRVAFLSMTYEVWWVASGQYDAIAHLNGTPLPVGFVRQMKERLQKPPRRNGRSYRPWDPFAFGSYTPAIAEQVDVMIPPKR